jgi:hypothetical protein
MTFFSFPSLLLTSLYISLLDNSYRNHIILSRCCSNFRLQYYISPSVQKYQLPHYIPATHIFQSCCKAQMCLAEFSHQPLRLHIILPLLPPAGRYDSLYDCDVSVFVYVRNSLCIYCFLQFPSAEEYEFVTFKLYCAKRNVLTTFIYRRLCRRQKIRCFFL